MGAFIRKRRKRRESLGLSIRYVSRILGYKSTTMHAVERGVKGPPWQRLLLLADVLQVDRFEFFRFVTGEAGLPTIDGQAKQRTFRDTRETSKAERRLLAILRMRSTKYKRRILVEAEEYLKLGEPWNEKDPVCDCVRGGDFDDPEGDSGRGKGQEDPDRI